MRFTRLLMLAAAVCLCHVTPATADDYQIVYPEAHTRLGMDFGIALGGSDVLDPAFTHGVKPQTDQVAAGDDEYLGLHLTQDLWHTRFAVQLAAAYGSTGEDSFLCNTDSGSTCHYTLQRMEYWAKLQYRLNDHLTLGVGRVFHRNIILESFDDSNAFPNLDFRPAAGWVLEMEARQDDLFAGIRYTHIMYVTADTGASANASSIGVYFGIEGDLF